MVNNKCSILNLENKLYNIYDSYKYSYENIINMHINNII